MRNLGPATEQDLNAAGIMTADELIKLGAEEAFVRMLVSRQATGRSSACCNASYLYAIYGAIHDIDWRELPTEQKAAFKAFAAEIRESKRFAN